MLHEFELGSSIRMDIHVCLHSYTRGQLSLTFIRQDVYSIRSYWVSDITNTPYPSVTPRNHCRANNSRGHGDYATRSGICRDSTCTHTAG